jgi:translocation and assembly module TamA
MLLRLFFIFLVLGSALISEEKIQYSVEFSGIEGSLLDSLQEHSQLMKSQDLLPFTVSSLNRRIQADIEHLTGYLQSHSYYDPRISSEIHKKQDQYVVHIHIDKGSLYTLSQIQITDDEGSLVQERELFLLGEPFSPKQLIVAEQKILNAYAHHGFPYASISKGVLADRENAILSIDLRIDRGPFVVFGKTLIQGNSAVTSSYIEKKIYWTEGHPYDSSLVDQTVKALEESQLFSTVSIKEQNSTMLIEVQEEKLRSIAFGVGYSTQRGPGGTAEWQHRNFLGEGEHIHLHLNLLERTQDISLLLERPHFFKEEQTFYTLIDGQHDQTKGFTETSLSLSAMIERQWQKDFTFSCGSAYTYLENYRSLNDGTFHLYKAPLLFRYCNIDNFLDPLSGHTFFCKISPTTQLVDSPFFYVKMEALSAYYKSLWKDGRLVFAAKTHIGMILGASKHTIPSSEKFYAGSESLLRGYRYYTVCPLNPDQKPLGGRSLAVFSTEMRYRSEGSWGAVVFYDIGNVWNSPLPCFQEKFLQSAGVGYRYYTGVGPMRFDLAFPLNKRKDLDPPFQFYFSVGQSF